MLRKNGGCWLLAVLLTSYLALSNVAAQKTAPIAQTPAGYNCEPLSNNFQVRWLIDGNNIKIELVARMESDFYMAFGPSGRDPTSIIGSDLVVAGVFDGEPSAVDYYVTAATTCKSGTRGICPDQSSLVSDVSGERNFPLQISLVRYTRPLKSPDNRDTTIYLQAVNSMSWALGPSNGRNGAEQHLADFPNRAATRIVPGREVADNCDPLASLGGSLPTLPPVVPVPATEPPVVARPTPIVATDAPTSPPLLPLPVPTEIPPEASDGPTSRFDFE